MSAHESGSAAAGASRRTEPATLFFALLLGADAVFVAVHLAHELSPHLADRLYSLETDRGYAELFQYVKTFWVVVLLGWLWWCTRERLYAAWMVLFGYLLCDDALQAHERGGWAIAQLAGLGGGFGLRAQDLGELLLCAGVGGALALAVALLWRRSTPDARNACADLALLLGVLAAFGVGVDMVHVLSGEGRATAALAVVEDGGELLAMSAACAYVLHVAARGGRVPATLWRTWRPAPDPARAEGARIGR